jgi:hypothetical protein
VVKNVDAITLIIRITLTVGEIQVIRGIKDKAKFYISLIVSHLR